MFVGGTVLVILKNIVKRFLKKLSKRINTAKNAVLPGMCRSHWSIRSGETLKGNRESE